MCTAPGSRPPAYSSPSRTSMSFTGGRASIRRLTSSMETSRISFLVADSSSRKVADMGLTYNPGPEGFSFQKERHACSGGSKAGWRW